MVDSPALTPVDFDPFATAGEDPADAVARYEAHLLELHHAQQQSSHLQSGSAGPISGLSDPYQQFVDPTRPLTGLTPDKTYLGGVVRRAGDVASERLANALDVTSAPMDVLQGVRSMTPDEVQHYGSALSKFASTGGFGRAALTGELRPDPSKLGIIAGTSAKTADLGALALRDRIANPLLDPRNVGAWRSTGWYYGPEGLPKFEISDFNAKLTGAQDLLEQGDAIKLGDLWNHPELYKAYPHLADVPVEVGGGGGYASYQARTGTIHISEEALRAPDLEQSIAHEVQHAVADKEGFARGANTAIYHDPVMHATAVGLDNQVKARMAEIKDRFVSQGGVATPEEVKWISDAREAIKQYQNFMHSKGEIGYQASAGENEARAVENRLNLSVANNKLVPPWKTEVPVEKQDVVPQITRPGYQRGKGGFGPEEPIGQGGKGPTEPEDVKKSTEAAIATPSATSAPPPEQIRQIIATARAVPWTVDRSHDVPYGAGASTTAGKTYIDRRIPSKMTVGGKSFDPSDFLSVHEQVEHRLMERGLTYEEAHRYATAQERAKVESAGVNWKKYEKAMERYLDVTESERGDRRLPADLYTKPYSHSDLRKFKGKAAKNVN